MKTTDSRRLDATAQFELRLKVVTLREEGKSNQEISSATGLNRTHVSTIWQRYLSGGIEALEPKRRGRKQGKQRTLTLAQERAVMDILLTKTPQRLGLTGTLWTREAVRLAIGKEFGVQMGLRTVSDYLQRWGITVPKPALSAPETLPVGTRWWLETTYPAVAARAKEVMAEIRWLFVTRVACSGALTESRADADGNESDSMLLLSAVNNRGKFNFMLYSGAMTAQLFVRFLSRLRRDAQGKVFAIICAPPVRHDKLVTSWLAKHKSSLVPIYPPPYSPRQLSEKKREGLFAPNCVP
jgi:transposase